MAYYCIYYINYKHMVQTTQKALTQSQYAVIATKYDHRIVRPEDIIRGVCDYFGLQRDQVISRSRKRDIVTARMLSMWFVYHKCPEQSTTSVGDMFGSRDHTTVLHAKNTVMNLTNGPTPVWREHFECLQKLFN